MSQAGLLSRPWVRTLALIVCVLVLVSLLWQSDERSAPLDAESLRGPSEPDGFVINGHYRAFDASGQLSTIISSPRIEQFDADQTATMENPDATLIDSNSGIPWKLTARTGTFHQSSNLIDLEGSVVVTRQISEHQEGTLETEQLTLDNSQRTVYTDAAVIMTDGRSTTRATGMKAWIDDRTLELKSQVEGHYEPANTTSQ